MANLIDFYTDFVRIDLDAKGGYARVADVVAREKDGTSIHRAFKLMRHELGERQIVGMQRFENELKMLIEITKDKKAPIPITRIHDSGFAPVDLSNTLQKLHEGEKLSPKLQIVSTGIDLQKFLEVKSALMSREPDRWLPYLVVELAPYGDALLRQIKPQSAKEHSNLYRLPVSTIVDMSLQLLDVMDYLHRKIQYAYIDWKPEHIYWNGSIKQLKLIDWNVTNRLTDNPNDKQIIREDLRMFCGAAMYCSLALTDPEDLKRSIGPAPTLPRNLTRPIPPRYWTDKPNFYERDAILDEKIKQIVQKGLDPRQGFNTPQEMKSALVQYADQRARQDVPGDDLAGMGPLDTLPQEATQHYRRARSYIAAEDYSLAAIALEVALETARAAGMTYPDAQNLYESVRNIIEAGKFREKVKLALEDEEWNKALDMYKKAIDLAPSNPTMQKEFDGLQGLLLSEPHLRKKGLSRIFTNTYRLQTDLESTKDIIDSRNPLYVFVKQQLSQIRLFQFSGVFTLLVVLFLGLGLSGTLNFSGLIPVAATNTSSPTAIASATSIAKPIFTATLDDSSPPGPSITLTITPTPTVTNTIEPSPTATTVLNYGVLNVSFFFPVVEPNGRRIGTVLEIEQFVTIVEERTDIEQLWYKCVWEINGVRGEGWILAANIQFVPPPTPTP